MSSGAEAMSLAAGSQTTLVLADMRLIELACLLGDRHAVSAVFLLGISDLNAHKPRWRDADWLSCKGYCCPS